MIVMSVAFNVFQAERGDEAKIRLHRHESHRAEIFAGHDVVARLAAIVRRIIIGLHSIKRRQRPYGKDGPF